MVDRREDAAVFCRSKNIGVENFFKLEGAVRLQFDKFDIYSCYISPNIPLDAFKGDIDNIMYEVRRRKREAIIVGDLNAKSPAWGSPTEDARGVYLTEWAAVLDLVVINRGDTPTFVRGESKSFIDITLATTRIASKIKNWTVSDEESLSLHRFIYFELDVSGGDRTLSKKTSHQPINKEKLGEILHRTLIEQDITSILSSLKRAQDDSKVVNNNRNRSTPYWWNAEIAIQRNICNMNRRMLTRARRLGNQTDDMDTTYKGNRKLLRDLIRSSKRNLWKEVCMDLDNDIWGQGYKIAVKSLGVPSPPYNISLTRKIEIINELFPKTKDGWRRHEAPVNAPPFDMEELILAGKKMKTKKAAGLDDILPDTVKKAVEVAPAVILNIMNRLLESQSFPAQWKRARVVLIPKGKLEDSGSISSYRPICILNAMGKLYEMLIRERLVSELKQKRAISDQQFGFCRGRSTTQAVLWVTEAVKNSRKTWCAFVALDVKNAFNTARWSIIIDNMKKIGISKYLINSVENYLCGRTVEISGSKSIGISAGVPQGSILGPTLWNILYDGVLRIGLPEDCRTVAYADDLGLIVEADYKDELCEKTDVAILIIESWMSENHLKLAPHKTEAVILKGERNRNGVVFHIMGMPFAPQKSVRYLGIWLDEKLSFKEHILQIKKKAEAKVAALARIMPNIGGPSYEKRKVLAGVAKSIMMYGAPIWGAAMKVAKNRALLESIQRKSLLRITSAYRTASTKALQIIAGVLPIDLEIEELGEMYGAGRRDENENRSQIRARTISKWQQRWTETLDVAQWTKQLIPHIERWWNCKHKRIDFHLTQFLTGHGSFRTFTFRIGKTADENCIYCGATDTPSHTIFACPRWQVIRHAFELDFGARLDSDNITDVMLTNEVSWRKVHGLIKSIMKEKEKEEIDLR